MQNCGQHETASIKLSTQSHLVWKKRFPKNSFCFRISANFEVDNEIDTSSIETKIKQLYKQNPVCNGYYKESELNTILQSGYYESPLGYDNVDRFLDEVIRLKNKLVFCFLNTSKDNIMTEADEESYRNNVCRFCENEIISNKNRDQRHLNGKYRGPAHNKCKNIFTQKQSNFVPLVFHNFNNCDCHLIFRS